MPRKPIVRGNLPAYASNIRRLLRERELTHAQFSQQVGLSPQSMYAALNGGDIRVSTLLRMAKALNVEPHILMQPEAVKPPEVMPVPSGMNPTWNLINALLGGQFQPQPTVAVPSQLVELLGAWGKLSQRDLTAVMSMVKSLSENKVVDALHRHAAQKTRDIHNASH